MTRQKNKTGTLKHLPSVKEKHIVTIQPIHSYFLRGEAGLEKAMKELGTMSKSQVEVTKEKFKLGSAPDYVDKDQLAQDGTAFTVTFLEYQKGLGYEGADRWLMKYEVEGDPQVYVVSFGCNEKRDEVYSELAKNLPYGPVVLKKSGQAHYLNDPE